MSERLQLKVSKNAPLHDITTPAFVEYYYQSGESLVATIPKVCPNFDRNIVRNSLNVKKKRGVAMSWIRPLFYVNTCT